MILRKLPYPGSFPPNGQEPVFPDHTLFTTTTTSACARSEFTAAPGIFTVLAGSARCCLNTTNETLDDRQFLLINQGSRVSVTLSNPGVQPLFLFFHTGLIHAALKSRGADLVWLERTHTLQAHLRQQLKWISRLGNSCASFSALKADSLIRNFMEEMINQALLADRLSKGLRVVKRTTRIDLFQRLSRTREWIQVNYAAPLALDDMAAVASMNSQHFLRQFRDCYGITPHRFLTRIRLEAARQLLQNSGETVSAICHHPGFESLSSFSGLFRQRYGLPPSASRGDHIG